MFMSVDDIDKQCSRGLNQSQVSEHEWNKAPFDDECLRLFFQRINTQLKRYYQWEEMIYTALYFIISISALISNGVVILAVIRKKKMRTNQNVLIVNLALSNLVLALTTIPFLWWPSIDFEFPYSKFFCKFANALPGSNIYCSTLTISIMAVDRYYSVKRIEVVQSKHAQIMISMAIWIASFVLSFPLIVYYDTTILYVFKDVMVYEHNDLNKTAVMRSYGWRQCRLSLKIGNDESTSFGFFPLNARFIQLTMSLLQVLFLYVVPLIVLSIFNIKLTRFLRLNAKRINRLQPKALCKESDCGNSPVLKRFGLSKPSVTNSQNQAISTLNTKCLKKQCCTPVNQGAKTKMSSSSKRAAKRKRYQTTNLLITMACSYAVLWLPFTLVSMLIDLEILNIVLIVKKNRAGLIERIDQACKLISITSICVNPFLYGFLNTNFRHEFTDIFKKLLCLPKLLF